MAILTAREWDQFLAGYPDAHLLQCSAWGDLKSEFGWQVRRVRTGDCGAQVLFRRLPLGFTIAYIPKGPVGNNWRGLWPEVDRVCRGLRAVLLKLEPDQNEPVGKDLPARLPNFRPSQHSIQPPRTILVSLEGDEEQWLARMKQKTRYNIRLAEKKGVVVKASQNLDTFYQLMTVTGSRDGFGVHSKEYFRSAFEKFYPSGACDLLIAEFDGRPLAGLMVFARGRRAWYLYGASNDEERNRMPTYLLQWQAMRWAKAKGCSEYDLWGVPDENEDVLEADFENRSDGLWGVYRFKRGFGGILTRSTVAWDRPYLPFIYPLYLKWARRRGETA